MKPAISSWAASVVRISVIKCSPGSPFFFVGSSWIDSLHHVYLVADPLVVPLIGIMSLGIMRVLYRARGPLANGIKLSLHHLKLLPKHSAQ